MPALLSDLIENSATNHPKRSAIDTNGNLDKYISRIRQINFKIETNLSLFNKSAIYLSKRVLLDNHMILDQMMMMIKRQSKVLS